MEADPTTVWGKNKPLEEWWTQNASEGEGKPLLNKGAVAGLDVPSKP